MSQNPPTPDKIPLADHLDREILMHREIHFGGQFSFMLDYYKKGGPGINPSFTIERIEALDFLEKELQQNLAPLYLTGIEAEQVAKQRAAYKQLRDLYEHANKKKTPGILLADLVLSESEIPEEEIAAIVKEREVMLPLLLDLLKCPDYYDILSPGFGRAPERAVLCLERIGDKRAMMTLFESIGAGDFFDDEQIFRALKAIGNPAKEFLLRIVSSHPIREDNERAAMALSVFYGDEEVSLRCLSLLEEDVVRQDPSLAPYLLYATENLAKSAYRDRWLTIVRKNDFSPLVEPDRKRMQKKYE